MSLFITFEGIEGSGKSTHLRQLATHLRSVGRPVLETREPGGTPAGATIRRLLLGEDAVPLTPMAELFLYCADRTQHVAQVIRPALAGGRIVLCDRFSDSTIVYQGFGRGLDLGAIRALDERARAGLAPALTFLFDCPVVEGLRRVRERRGSGDRFERESEEFHERIRAGFQALAAAEPERFRVLDTTQPVEQVRQRVIAEATVRLEGEP